MRRCVGIYSIRVAEERLNADKQRGAERQHIRGLFGSTFGGNDGAGGTLVNKDSKGYPMYAGVEGADGFACIEW